jgi:hypothetical protein
VRADEDALRDALMIPDSLLAVRLEMGLRLRAVWFAAVVELAQFLHVPAELVNRAGAESDRVHDLAELIAEARAASS